MKILHVTQVEYAGGFKLRLRFNDGSKGVANLAGHLTGPLAPLSNAKLFAQVFLDEHTACWPGDLDLAPEYLHALANGLSPPKTGEDVERNQRIVGLRALRDFAGHTQVDLAEALEISQGDISKLERRSDVKLSTLAKYVRALGGELELLARLGNRTLTLEGLVEEDPERDVVQPARRAPRSARKLPPQERVSTKVRKGAR